MPTSRDVVEAFYAQRSPPAAPPQGYFQWGGKFANPQGWAAERLQNQPPDYHPTFQGDPRQAWILTRPHQWGSAELPGMAPGMPPPPSGMPPPQQPGWPPGTPQPQPPAVQIIPDPEANNWGRRPLDI